MRKHILATLFAGAPLCLWSACNHTPILSLDKSFSLRVDVSTRDDAPIKIDFLWVVDNSSSMCEEQSALSRSFDAFVQSLDQSLAFDARIAVTSVAAQSAEPAGGGRFNQRASSSASVGCIKGVQRPCGGHVFPQNVCDDGLDCAVLGQCDTDTVWACSNRANVDACVSNPNGSINESCKRRCSSDEDCQHAFGDPALRCLHPGEAENSGCVYDPPTAGCPDVLPPFLQKNGAVDNSELFPCIASVGLSSGSAAFRYEEPLRSASLALGLPPDVDDHGAPKNLEQARAFLRADAYLVIIIVTDEEDCSTMPRAPGQLDPLGEVDGHAALFDVCGLQADTEAGGPLVPVSHFVNRFKSLKNDPSKVIVAVVAGDSLATDPAQQALEREQYLSSKGEPLSCRASTSICQSDTGIADYGRRLIQLAAAFGPNGTFENICGADGIGPALTHIADGIIAVVNRVCLPKPIRGQLRVTRTRGAEVTELHEGQGPGTFTIITTAEDCATDGQALPAIALADRPLPDDVIDIVYEGEQTE